MLDPSCEAEDLDLLILVPPISQALGLKEYTSMNGAGDQFRAWKALYQLTHIPSSLNLSKINYFRCVFPPEPIGSIFLILVYDLLLKQNYFT